jgi:hypothetical protein
VAKQTSQSLRDSADQELARIVKAKAAEVETKEAELKMEIERLWFKFKQGLDKIQQDRPHAPPSSATWISPSRTNDHRSHGLKAPVAIPGFNPVSVTTPTTTTPPPPRKSGLSESLSAHSHIHEIAKQHLLATHPTNGSEATSVHSESPTIVPNSANEREVTSILHYRRRIDDAINTAASYKYFLDLDTEMAQLRKERKPEANPDQDETLGMGLPGPSKQNANGSDEHSSDPSPSGDSKGKKKEKQSKNKNKHVHFDVQPSAKEAKPSASKKSSDSSKPDPGGRYLQREA